MCIRDSGQHRVRLTAAEGRLQLDDRLATLAVQPLRHLDQHCLLYTSDAADERSSVDLGGRRIIKKKKTKNNAMHTAPPNEELHSDDRQSTTRRRSMEKERL